MNFECPNCKKSGQVDDSKVPESGIYAICPQCSNKFLVKREAPKDFEFESVEQSVSKVIPLENQQSAAPKKVAPLSSGAPRSTQTVSNKDSFWVGKPMRYLYALIACFVVLILAAAIKGLFGWGPIEGGAIPALIISIAIFGTWYVITKQRSNKVWVVYFIVVLVIGIFGTIIAGNISQIKTEDPAPAAVIDPYAEKLPPIPDGYKLVSPTATATQGMKTYTITHPVTGRVIEITSSTLPTEAEIDKAFASAPSTKLTPIHIPPGAGHKGKVLQTMDAGPYTYVEVEENGNMLWIAVMREAIVKEGVKIGDTIEFPDSPPLLNFQSKELRKTFDKVIFSAGLRKTYSQ